MLDSAILAAMLTERPSRSRGSPPRAPRDAAELDQLERHPAGAGRAHAPRCRKAVDALVGPNRDRRDAGERGEPLEVRMAERLLEEQKRGVARALDIGRAAASVKPQLASAQSGVSNRSPGEGRACRNFGRERLDADLELEETGIRHSSWHALPRCPHRPWHCRAATWARPRCAWRRRRDRWPAGRQRGRQGRSAPTQPRNGRRYCP